MFEEVTRRRREKEKEKKEDEDSSESEATAATQAATKTSAAAAVSATTAAAAVGVRDLLFLAQKVEKEEFPLFYFLHLRMPDALARTIRAPLLLLLTPLFSMSS